MSVGVMMICSTISYALKRPWLLALLVPPVLVLGAVAMWRSMRIDR